MKKRVKIPVIVFSSVVGAILIAVIVLCSITVRPLKQFMDYQSARVTTGEYTLPNVPLSDPNGAYKGKLDKNLKKTGFTVMHATLEFVGNYGPEFVTEKNDEGKTVNKKVTVSEAQAACAASADAYKLELEFDSEKTFKVGKTEVSYDRLVMQVKNTDGELRWATVYLYLSRLDGAQNEESEDYRIVPVRMRMNTSPLYIALGEIAADMVA